MLNLALEWRKKENVTLDAFPEGASILCVKPEGLIFKLTVEQEKGCLVDYLGNKHNFEDFVEFCDMHIEEEVEEF